MKAFKVLGDDGKWIIYFNPRFSVDSGDIIYDTLSGYCDEKYATMVVALFNKYSTLQNST
jgi:hypothetical protein